MTEIKMAAIIGGGIIGGGWAARLLENGIDVAVFDPAPDAKTKFDAVLANAEQAFAKLSSVRSEHQGKLSWYDTAAAAAANAQLIIESVPERLDIKRAVYAEIETTAASDKTGQAPDKHQPINARSVSGGDPFAGRNASIILPMFIPPPRYLETHPTAEPRIGRTDHFAPTTRCGFLLQQSCLDP